MKHIQTLSALFFFPGFSTRSRLLGIFGDPHAQLVTLVRRKKPRCAPVAGCGCLQSDRIQHLFCLRDLDHRFGSCVRRIHLHAY